MSRLSAGRKTKIAARTALNIVRGKPVTVSFEITYNCNANCEHCDLGHYVEEPRLGPEVFADWVPKLNPAVAQISGGEPTLRKDLVDIAKAMRAKDSTMILVVTTNVHNLNEKRYLDLKEAGIDHFSFSLDYPDQRHNTFRHLKKNFEHMEELVPKLAKHDNQDIIMACVVQSDNFRELPKIAEVAKRWGVACNFSTYNSLRTGKDFYFISEPDDQAELAEVVEKLLAMQKEGYPILTSEWTLRAMMKFFKAGKHTNCKAGKRFAIVNPWGKLTPCGMVREQFDTQADMVERFTQENRCEKCFTAIRANCEKTPGRMLKDSLRAVRAR
ncbi:MAG: radical SAM protein [candidate division Zixibacteria bacterium]|nr:radical SAM protein [candidate division Zixibacteria bacterium]MDH3937194.1 radical SAM protein [candidate division Zixibacteria bacterium]MDH4032457.1 radical SAM protein [candidate division Zixibacteria bacterium]